MLERHTIWAADASDPRATDIVAKTIGIDTDNHIDASLEQHRALRPDVTVMNLKMLEMKGHEAFSERVL